MLSDNILSGLEKHERPMQTHMWRLCGDKWCKFSNVTEGGASASNPFQGTVSWCLLIFCDSELSMDLTLKRTSIVSMVAQDPTQCFIWDPSDSQVSHLYRLPVSR